MSSESKLNELLANANQASIDLQQSINNYKKSPKDRLTESYITSYKEKINKLWLNFQSIDRKLRDVLPESHKYFEEDAYGNLGKKYQDVLEQIKVDLEKLKDLSRASTSHVNQPSGLENTIAQQKLHKIIQTVHTMINQVLSASNQTSAFYERKLKCIDQHWSHATSIHEKLWAVVDNYDYEAYVTEEEAVNNGMIEIQEKISHAVIEPPATPRHVTNEHQLKLPKIELPMFNGEYLKWRNFHDLFSELVDKQQIPSCQKLLYLKSSLSGEAEGLVKNYATTTDNYSIVWQTLKDRYDNKRILVNAILQKMLTQPVMHNENVALLKLLHDTTHECLQSLNNLGVSTETWDPIVLHILVQQLSKATHALWEQSLANPQSLPSLVDFLNFIKLRFQSLEALGAKTTSNTSTVRIQAHVSGTPTQVKSNCFICQGYHKIYACQNFLQKTPRERLQIIQKARRCVNCLRIGHSSKDCNSSSCSQCNKRHNSLLHLDTSKTQSKQSINNGNQATAVKPQSSQHIAATAFKNDSPNFKSVLLSTVIVNITARDGTQHPCKALLDSGSQANFMSAYFAKKLSLPISSRELGIEGIGQTQSYSTGRINIELTSIAGGYKKRIEVLVLPKLISSQPMQPIDTSKWKIPSNITLADPTFAKPGRIDLLIGAGLFYSLLSVGQISLGVGLPTIQKTLLGWIISGEYTNIQDSTLHCGVGITDNSTDIDESLEKFWKLEEFENGSKTFTESEMRCEQHFLQNVRRHEDGRFIVKLPFDINPLKLGSSRDIALQRFYSIERKLERNPQLRTEYVKFMKEYEGLNHMTEIAVEQITDNHYFLPHHAVFKLDSTSTKVRVVFDASAKTSSSFSLNDVLSTGPTIQSDVFTTILRFRFPRYAFTADIEKMYRQIWVSKEDQKYQLIWWREQPTDPLKCFQLATVTYGTTCAPFLATRVLQHIADVDKDQYPMASKALQNNFYVDDVLSGANKISEALETQKQLLECLRASGMNLRKWCANDARLLEKISYKDKEVSLDMSDSNSENIKTMGITWYPKEDVFAIKIHQENNTKITKRTALAEIAKLFDPLGLVAPVVVTAKIFLQQLWKLKLDWDSALPQAMHTKWLQFLISLQQIKIPRHIYNHTSPKTIQLHVFADASESAYGAAAYVRAVDTINIITVRLLVSKSRVAPVKQLSIPRLELCAAKLATDLVERLRTDKILADCETFYWTDSTAVLGWINATSSNYHTFVANRISGIHQVSKSQQWHHVPSEQNPADLISRGIMPEQLINNTLWFFGPFFLHAPITGWPLQPPKAKCTLEMRELKLLSANVTASSESLFTTIRHQNSLPRLQRIIAYMMRFKTKKQTKIREAGSLLPPNAKEMDNAIKTLVKISQQEYFADELKSLNKHQSVHNNSVMSTLSPFIDDEGIIRVGGRLKASELQFDAKHQMLLPYNSPLTKIIFMALHKENKHVGAQTLLCIVRQRFWPIKGKNIARSVVQGCILCTRAKPKLYQQLMGDLPKDRVQPARPFVNTGVDFFGPIWVHMKIRGKRPLKAYVAVFCCFAVKAVHLELVSDLSTEAFLGALRRFMARRGHCNKIYCDNATNFVGASNQLSEIRNILHTDKAKESILNECASKNIAFEFIPPRAPHFGGLWEAAVKSAKHLLQSSLSAANLTGEEIQTLLAEAEAIMNSRPLTALSTDPNDLNALTPGHFLIGEPLTATADPYDQQNQLKPLTRWKLVTQLKREFWTRWTNEYLHSLQHRYKWKKEVQNISPGTMVLIKDDNLPSMKWSLGRIKNVIRGEDGLVRVADVQTAKQIIRRPINKLAPLPTEQEIEPIYDDHDTKTTPHDTSSPKRPRLTSLASTLFLVLLLLPLCMAEKTEIVPFQKNPGIYFENIGSANVISSEWNVISYVNITNYWKWIDRVKHYPDTLRDFCNITKRKSCSFIVSLLEHSTSELEINNELLRHNPVSRKKRGAVNIIGNIAHSLFGVLDENYAADTAVTINQLVQNEKRIVNEVHQQKTFLDNTINIMKKDQQEIEKEFGKIESALDKFRTFIQQKQGENEFMELALQTTLASSYLLRIQESLLDVITDSHHGRINPELISPIQLETEIHRIKAELPPSLKIPDTSDFLKLLSLTHIESRIVGDLAIFVIKLPLVTPEEYEILHLVPVPFIKENTFHKVKTEYTYIIINLHRDQYYLLKETSLTSCVHLEDQRFLCHENHPLYLKGSRAGLCEINLLNHVNNTSSCLTEVTEPGPHWFQLHNQNWWLFSLHGELVLNVVCNNELTKITLKNNGLLKLMENCVVKQPRITIKAYKRHRTSELKGYIPDIDDSLMIPTHNHQYIETKPLKSLNLSASRSALEKIQNTKLNLELNTPDGFRSHDIHHYLLGYTCLSGILILCSYLIKRKYFKRKAPVPDPVPSQIKSTTSYDLEMGDRDSAIITISQG